MTPPSLPFKTEPVTTGTSRPVVCTADAWDREAQFKENRRTSLPGKRPLSNSRLPVTTSSLKRSREDRAYGPQRSEFGCSPISTRQSVTQALIGDESSRSCSCSGYYRVPRHSMAVQATTPSWDPATVADDVQYPLGKQDFCSDEFFHSDEDFFKCTHVVFLSLALLGISVLCFWAFYAVGDMNFGVRAYNDHCGDVVLTVASQDAVGTAMRKILLDERPLHQTHTAARHRSPPPKQRYFEAAIENNSSSDRILPQTYF